jgi:hypothetical protein
VLVSTIAEEVSINCNVGREVFNAGAAVKAAVTDIESCALPKNETVTTAEVAV